MTDNYEDLLFWIGLELPFLREELSEIKLIRDKSLKLPSTDGSVLYVPEEAAVSPDVFLHTFVHLVYLHPVRKSGEADPLRDIACDMSAEVLRSEIFPYEGGEALRRRIRDIVGERCDPLDPEDILSVLMDMYPDEIKTISSEFSLDSHECWGRSAPAYLSEKERSSIRENLEKTAEKLSAGRGERGDIGQLPGNRFEKALLREKGRSDLRRYLKRFADTGEEMTLDTDSFDYIPYSYGIERTGNVPFIEPLEYRESSKVRDMAIAIDTSGSCSAETISFFLSEIEHMLMDSDSFFDSMNVHVLQCDARVRDHAIIRSREEWKKYTKKLTLKGRGGTDFRPVFELLESLYPVERDLTVPGKGRRNRLRGLLYFTDGKGIFPEKEPSFDTAFVLPGKKGLGLPHPSWARLLVLGKKER